MVPLKIVSNVSRFMPALNLNRVLADFGGFKPRLKFFKFHLWSFINCYFGPWLGQERRFVFRSIEYVVHLKVQKGPSCPVETVTNFDVFHIYFDNTNVFFYKFHIGSISWLWAYFVKEKNFSFIFLIWRRECYKINT